MRATKYIQPKSRNTGGTIAAEAAASEAMEVAMVAAAAASTKLAEADGAKKATSAASDR